MVSEGLDHAKLYKYEPVSINLGSRLEQDMKNVVKFRYDKEKQVRESFENI